MPGTATILRWNADAADLSARFQRTGTVVASPAADAETIIGSLTVIGNLQVTSGIMLRGFAAWTMGTDGASWNLKIRKTDASGSTLKATGLIELAATKLAAGNILAFDSSPTLPGQVYVLTLTITSGSAPSTVSAVELQAEVI